MSSKFYVPGARRADRVQDLFDVIAPRYDLINDLQSLGFHRRWKRRLVQLANVHRGSRALDVCCGTGDIALALARNGATVAALDFSAPMLSAAQQRASASTGNAAPRVERVEGGSKERAHQTEQQSPMFLRGDALKLPFGDASFDAVTISYGLRNLADLDAALRELLRVVKPGGRVLSLDFGKPENSVLRGLYFSYLKHLVPIYGRIFCGSADAYSYIIESLNHYPGQQGVAEKMRACGYANVRVLDLLGGAMGINTGESVV